MKQHKADILADKIANNCLAKGPLKERWFDLAPSQRAEIEVKIAKQLKKEIKK